MHTPPSSIEPRAGGDISVDRVLYEFSAKECHRAWANKPQRLNVVFYSPQDNQVYLYGSNLSGSQQVNAYNSQRILDKMTVLVERLLLNKVFQREGSVQYPFHLLFTVLFNGHRDAARVAGRQFDDLVAELLLAAPE